MTCFPNRQTAVYFFEDAATDCESYDNLFLDGEGTSDGKYEKCCPEMNYPLHDIHAIN